jgi:hypothetical protein
MAYAGWYGVRHCLMDGDNGAIRKSKKETSGM